jgi:hypothetical protein
MPKKKYEVIKATTRDIPGVLVGGKKRHFADNGMFTVSDAGEAAEIDKVLGAKGTGEVVVTSYDQKEPGHTYTFYGMGLRRTMYNFSKDPDYIQIRPGVWQLKKAIQKPKLRGRGAKPAGARNARGKHGI